jgi:hypothetical protein
MPSGLVRLGYQTSSPLFLEAEANVSTEPGNKSFIDVKGARTFALSVGGRLDLRPSWAVYGRIGAQQVRLSAANSLALSPLQPRARFNNVVGVLGIGAIWNFTETDAIRVDAGISSETQSSQPFFSDRVTARGVTVSYRRSF